MSIVKLRNNITGEITDVDNGSEEYRDLRAETYEHGAAIRPLYEITSADAADRIDANPEEADFGYQNKPVTAAPAVDGSQIVFGQRHKQLTPAEVDHGIKNYEQKRSEADAMQADWPGGPGKVIKADPADRRARGEKQAGNVVSFDKDDPRVGVDESGESEGSGASSGSLTPAQQAAADKAKAEAAGGSAGGSGSGS